MGYGVPGRMRKLCGRILAVALLAPLTAWAEPVKVVALGDSLVRGYGLQPDQGFVPQLQAWLAGQGLEAELVNAGVSGDTTSGGLARLDWALAADTGALIVELGANDILRAIAPDVARANLDAILAEAGTRDIPVLLVGIAVPPNYGPDYQAEFSAIYPELAGRYGTLLYPDFLRALTGRADQARTLADFFQPDGLHPNPDGVALIVEDIGPLVADLVALSRHPAQTAD